ncbi:MAG: hypothetical protein ABWX94_03520 [Candidatus Saccharimonadales bacterium]
MSELLSVDHGMAEVTLRAELQISEREIALAAVRNFQDQFGISSEIDLPDLLLPSDPAPTATDICHYGLDSKGKHWWL